jgi:hypothetical protein
MILCEYAECWTAVLPSVWQKVAPEGWGYWTIVPGSHPQFPFILKSTGWGADGVTRTCGYFATVEEAMQRADEA